MCLETASLSPSIFVTVEQSFGECDPAESPIIQCFFNWFHQAGVCSKNTGKSHAQTIQTVGFSAVQTSAEFRSPFLWSNDRRRV